MNEQRKDQAPERQASGEAATVVGFWGDDVILLRLASGRNSYARAAPHLLERLRVGSCLRVEVDREGRVLGWEVVRP